MNFKHLTKIFLLQEENLFCLFLMIDLFFMDVRMLSNFLTVRFVMTYPHSVSANMKIKHLQHQI